MSEWKEQILGNFIEVINGYAFKSLNFLDDKNETTLPILKIKNVANGDVNLNGVQHHEYDNRLSKFVVVKGDILLALTGNHPQAMTQVVGEASRYKLNEKAFLNQRVANIKPKVEIVNDYLYYFLKDDATHDYLANQSSGSANQANISKSDIENIPIQLPPFDEQETIASVLKSLDDKIDLLHRQNTTLEAMAETLFRQWFLEEAKEDWKVAKLVNYVDCINGVSYKSSELNPSKKALITLKNFDRNGGFRLDGFKEFTGKYKDSQIVSQGDLVVAHTDITQDADVIGNPIFVVADPNFDVMVISMDLVKVVSKYDWLSNEFLYLMMRTSEFKQHCLGYANGSTVLHLSKLAIPQYEFQMPSIELIEKFTIQAKPILIKKFNNITQIRTLTTLRDTLLPKLMSGEVRVEM